MTNTKEILLGSGRVEFDEGNGWQEFGLVRGLKLTEEGTEINIAADNGSVPLQGVVGQRVTVEFSLLERSMPRLQALFGGQLSVSKGSSRSVNETLAANFPADKLRALSHHNADNSKPAISVAKGNASLNEGADYRLVTLANSWYIVLTASHAQALTIRYTNLTPPTSYTLAKGAELLRQNLAMRITNRRKDQDSVVTRIFNLFYGFVTGFDSVEFKSGEEADAASPVALKFTFHPHPDLLESTPEASLYSETFEVS